jgi:hypothetical protein
MIIWLVNDEIQAKTQLRKTINFHETFNNVNECIDYITECKRDKIFFVIIEEFISVTLPTTHDLPQIYSIYIFSQNENQQIKSYSKVRGIYSQIIEIHQEIIQDMRKLVPDDNLPISVLPASDMITPSNRLSASFMYFQLFLNILLQMDVGNGKQDMIDECRRQYDGNENELKNIDDFQCNYTVNKAIEWYTRDTFLYRSIISCRQH